MIKNANTQSKCKVGWFYIMSASKTIVRKWNVVNDKLDGSSDSILTHFFVSILDTFSFADFPGLISKRYLIELISLRLHYQNLKILYVNSKWNRNEWVHNNRLIFKYRKSIYNSKV